MLEQVPQKNRSVLSRAPGEDTCSARACQEEKVPVELKDCGHLLIKQILKDRSPAPHTSRRSVTQRVISHKVEVELN